MLTDRTRFGRRKKARPASFAQRVREGYAKKRRGATRRTKTYKAGLPATLSDSPALFMNYPAALLSQGALHLCRTTPPIISGIKPLFRIASVLPLFPSPGSD